MYLSVIIPAYNEAWRIERTIRAIDAYVRSKHFEYEVIVVDDGSADETVQIVLQLAPQIAHLKLMQLGRNLGKGAAVQRGMLEAKGAYRLFTDADNSTAIEHWERMMPRFEEGYDIVLGSRHIEGSVIKVKQSPLRETLGYIFRFLVRVIVPLHLTDTQNGFKAFSAKAAESLFSSQRTAGWAFDVEILSRARKTGLRIADVPVTWKNDERSSMTFSGMPRMLADLIKIRFTV